MNCQFSVEKVKVQGHWTSETSRNCAYLAYMFIYLRQRRRPGRRLQTRPKPVLGQIYCQRSLDNWADSRISCRHSALKAAEASDVCELSYRQPVEQLNIARLLPVNHFRLWRPKLILSSTFEPPLSLNFG